MLCATVAPLWSMLKLRDWRDEEGFIPPPIHAVQGGDRYLTNLSEL